ncbi:MAG: acyl carrier protein [Rhodoferax sp.]|nr:acyl carrier protein [Rhodoferax sp.]
MKTESHIRNEIRQFVVEIFLLGDASSMLEDNQSFLESGTIDSTGVLEVVMFLEATYSFKVEDREILPENIDSVDNQVTFVLRKLNAA